VYPAEAPHTRIMDQKGYLFDAGAYVTIPYNVTHCFAPAKAFSVVVWVKLDAMPLNPLALVSHGTEWRLSLSATQTVILDVMDSAANYTTFTSTETVAAGTWTCVAVSWNGTAAVYLDGVVGTFGSMDTGTGFSAMTDGTAPTVIGSDGTNDLSATTVGDLTLWSRVLTSYEMIDLYNSGLVKGIGRPPICVSRYSFGDAELDSTSILIDVINSIDGVVTGTVTEAVDAAGGSELGSSRLPGYLSCVPHQCC